MSEVSEGWSEADFVLHFNKRLSPSLRKEAQGVSAPVTFYSIDPGPHTPAEEGLHCSACKVGLSFPRARA